MEANSFISLLLTSGLDWRPEIDKVKRCLIRNNSDLTPNIDLVTGGIKGQGHKGHTIFFQSPFSLCDSGGQKVVMGLDEGKA